MTSNVLLIVIEELLKLLKKHKIELVLMGGIATSVLARPRATFDIDGIISVSKEKTAELLTGLKKQGFSFNQRQPLKVIQGLPFLTLYFSRSKTYVDLFIATNQFQKEIIKRAKWVRYGKAKIKIISPEDLILVKLQSGREKDIGDAREIIMENKNELDYAYLTKMGQKIGVAVFLRDELKSLGIKTCKG